MSPDDVLGRRGFTLIEAVVALAIVTSVGAASLAALGANLRATERARDAVVASSLAQDRLTSVRLAATEDLLPLVDSLRSGRYAPPLDRYAWAIDTRAARVGLGLIEVTVTIEWEGGEEGVRTLVWRGG